jgi:hypothetical protein
MKPWILLAAIFAGLASARAVPPNDAVVTFNEINYNPTGIGEAEEWFELFNQMAVNVDLSGWSITGGVGYTFANGTVIPGGGHLVIAKTPGGIPGALGPFTGALSNSGDVLRLRDRNDRVMDELTYGDKGEWPIAPDGGGVTLAKRNPYSGSAQPGNWGPSTQAGGTPGTGNFPPPPSPTTTRVVPTNATWKYENSGAAPAANWNTVGFDDTSWNSGQGGFQFGGGQAYMDPPPPALGGAWTMNVWTGDADSGISSTKTYTHKIGLQRGSPFTPINGVTFDSPGSGVASGANWMLTGAPNLFNNNAANNLPAGTGSYQLCQNFFYGATDAGVTSHLKLTGLTPNQGYVLTFYCVGYGGPGIRFMQLTPSDGGGPFVLDENIPNNGNGMLVKYHYKAPADGTLTMEFLPLAPANTWHHYAFSNEVAATTPPQQIENTATSIAGFSSQLGGNFTRFAINAINNSGLTGGRHSVVPDGTMWLSNGIFNGGTDTLPADITFDLGSLVHLTSFHVWNYNEATNGLMTRGANLVEILTAQDAAGPFTSAGTFRFFKASGMTTEAGQHFEFDQLNVRYVRFNILSSHGGDNEFAGLSEVKFYKEGTPSSTPIPYREKIATLFNTGIAADGSLATAGTGDPHFLNVTNNVPAVVQVGHPAWLGGDGISQWTGLTANGLENVAAGAFTWRTTCDLSGYQPGSADVKFYVAADNRLNDVLLNGVSKGLSAVGFTSYIGPYTIPGFASGSNTIDFSWTNDGPNVNPGGFRVKWDATAQPILAKTTLAANPITTYFRKTFTNSGNPQSAYRLLLNYVADDGAVFYLNGTEIHRIRVTGVPTNTTPADSDQAYPKFSGSIEVPATALVTGTNVLAVELHQAGAGNPDAFLVTTLDLIETPPAPTLGLPVQFNEIAAATAGTFFVEIRNTSAGPQSLAGYTINGSGGQTYTFGAGASLGAGALLSLNQTTLGFRPLDGEKLFLTAPGGAVADAQVIKNNPQARDNSGTWLRPNASTPGAANTFTLNTNAVVVNEIMYHHHATYLPTGSTPNDEEWVELYNRSGAPVVLTGWGLRGGAEFDFAAAQTIPAGGYLVVSNNPAALAAKFPSLTVGTNLVGPLNGSLSNSDDVIRIEDANGNPVNEVHYYQHGRWDGRADGGGSSLELRNPDIDNAQPEAWAGSDETSRSAWQTFNYSGSAAPYAGTNDPTQYNEFIFGLLSEGEFLIDDISVTETGIAGECIQNGTFATDAGTWRLLGTHGSHGRTVVVDDPSAPGNKVLKVVATDETEHMHNHCETTLKRSGSFITINSGSSYTITFRARWLSGSPRLHSRLYFNRLARQSLLPIPDNNGTPGAANSRFETNPGPTFSGLTQSPVLPDAGVPALVRIAVADPQNVASVTLKWRPDAASLGNFNDVPMTLSNGAYEGSIPQQTAGTLVQFYIQATDGQGGTSTFPAAGPNSRALIRWKDGTGSPNAAHALRLLMLTPDANFLHLNTNVMSNDPMPCTIVYRENEVFYDASARLKSSERGRNDSTRLGFALEFDPTHLFRGTHTGISIDRSALGRGAVGARGISDIVNWHFINRAGGVPGMYNDITYFIAPRSEHTGSAQLVMSEFNDTWLDSQFDHGADEPVFKYELIYYGTTTVGGSPEGLKIPYPAPDDVRAAEFENITSTDKEAFRWYMLLGNSRTDDSYAGVLALNSAFRPGNPNFNTDLPNAIDVDEWMRVSAVYTLAGIVDCYMSGFAHNIKMYRRSDGRMLLLPWDIDFQSGAFNAGLILQPDISRITGASFAYQRLFYQHLQDLISTSFNTGYLAPWITHYQSFNTSGGNWADINTYVDARVAFVNSQINAIYGASLAFDITGPNGGADFSAPGPNVTLTGQGWVNVRTIRVQSSGLSLNVTWTSNTGWQVTVPIAPGANPITLEAYDYQGNLVGSDTITITGTGTVVAAAPGNLVISELHYHPADPTGAEMNAGFSDADDFEFIELLNIGSDTINLGGCQFVSGITYSLPNATLAPGAYLVIPRRTAAFALRHPGVPTAPEYFAAGSNTLSNSGEQVALVSATGADISRFTYKDGSDWPATPDGLGPSLVLIAPKANPAANTALHWRASAGNEGNPGNNDALVLPANLTADDDGNGLSNLVDHAFGSGKRPHPIFTIDAGQKYLSLVIERNPLAEVNWDIEHATTFFDWTPDTIEIVLRESLPGGMERITLRHPLPVLPVREFLRPKLTAKP